MSFAELIAWKSQRLKKADDAVEEPAPKKEEEPTFEFKKKPQAETQPTVTTSQPEST